MVAAVWSDPAVAEQASTMLGEWFDLLTAVMRQAEEQFGPIGPFRAEDVAALIGMVFLGGESLLLLGDRWADPVRTALRRVGDLISAAEA